MKKRSKLLFAAAIIGTIYFIYLISYFSSGISGAANGSEAIGAGLAAAIVAPHMVCVGLAVVFNWIGWAMNARWGALVAGILYSVSAVLMFLYAIFVVLELIFCFVAFAKMKQPTPDPTDASPQSPDKTEE